MLAEFKNLRDLFEREREGERQNMKLGREKVGKIWEEVKEGK